MKGPNAQDAEKDEEARRRRIRAAWDAYHDHHPKPLATRTVRGPNGQVVEVDDNLAMGWCGDALRTGLWWLMGDGAPLTVRLKGDPSDAETEAAQAWLDDVWDRSGGFLLDLELATLGGITGHAIARINTLGTVSGTVGYRSAPHLVEVVALDAADVEACWSPTNVHRPTEWEVTWRTDPEMEDGATAVRQKFTPTGPLAPHVATGWTITEHRTYDEGQGMGSQWVPMGEPIVWPHPWPPIADCQNLPAPAQFWGRSDIDAVAIALNRAGTARASDLNRTERLHAHPTPTAKGMTEHQAAGLQFGADQVAVLPDPGMELDYLTLPEGTATSLEWLHEVHEQFRQHVNIPAVASGQLADVGALSGVALQILFQPLLAVTRTKRKTYGKLRADLASRLLALAGWEGTAVTQWPDLMPSNDLESWQTAVTQKAAGVSAATVLTERGYDPDAEAEAIALERARDLNSSTAPYA